MKAAIYTRISQDATGKALGVTRQREDSLALANRLGWEMVERFDDNDLSAFDGRTRPKFEAMLDAMKRSEFGGLICWHPDRLYRSMRDLELLIEVADAGGVQIRTVNGGDLRHDRLHRRRGRQVRGRSGGRVGPRRSIRAPVL